MPGSRRSSTLVAVGGLVLAYTLYAARARERDPVLGLPGYTLLEHKYYLDDLYLRGIVLPGPRPALGRRVLVRPARPRRRRQRRGARSARGLSKLVMLFDRA